MASEVQGCEMKIVKCKFETDRWGLYITPMLGYSNTERGKNLWFGWLKWLFTVELTNEGSTYTIVKDDDDTQRT